MRRIGILLLISAVAGALAWMFAQAVSTMRPLASLFPVGPVLYLEARDFQSLLKDWNSSQEKKLWLASDNYQVFSRSNLFLKLQNAQNEFAAAAGLPPNMALLDGAAGTQSAIAIYDIGELQFLYITRMPEAKFAESALWKIRGNYQPRKASGLDYYVRVDRASKRVAAFASTKEYLVLATREDVLAGALSLISGQGPPNLTQEPWFRKALQSAKQAGELRLVMNMERLLQSPYMRSYWIQRNASELKQYSAAISDVRHNASELDESRILFRTDEAPVLWNEAAVPQIVRLAPPAAGLYRAWASPTSTQAFDLLRRKIFEPQAGAGVNANRAPTVPSMDATVGSESDLEIRIDEPPLEVAADDSLSALRGLLDRTKLEAAMQIESSRVLADGTFVGIDSAMVLLANSDWNSAAVKAATAGVTGGLTRMTVDTNGKILVAATRPELAQSIVRAATNQPGTQAARYAAQFRHSAELPNFATMTRLIDTPLKTEGPSFFSGNIASLGRALGRLDSISITVHDTGSVVSQDVAYRWKQ